jgi:hypothetical protein
MTMQEQFFHFYRAGIQGTADMMSGAFDAARRLQQEQLEAWNAAMEEQASSMRQLAEVRSVEDLMALQARVAGTQMQRAMALWGSVWRMAAEAPARYGMRDTAVATSTSIANALREAAQNEHHDERKSA